MMRLTVEGYADIRNANASHLQQAVAAMAASDGPTYLVLADGFHNYVQAAGTDDRYVVEARDVYGEGFRHWRAIRPGSGKDGPSQVFFRQRCPKNNHPPRGCPLAVRANNVLPLKDVANTLLDFLAAGKKTAALEWQEASAEFLPGEDSIQVREITPRAQSTERF